jgi:hypothetical protein
VKPPADAVVEIASDAWCDVAVDGVAKGRANKRLIVTVPPGPHEVTCNGALGARWTSGTIELAPGEHRPLSATLLPAVTLKVALTAGDAVRVGGAVHANGATFTLKQGRYDVEVLRSGKPVDHKYLGVSVACTLRDRPAIECWP